ncbi:peptide chain release factor 1 [Candidatus Ishikawella capsulata]|nr:peptide chain release factor 1 [Candidatus Ishikawaella capsulata]
MKVSILSKLEALQERYKEIELLLSDANVIANQKYFKILSREYVQLNDIITHFSAWQELQKNIATVKLLIADPEVSEIADEELKDLLKKNESIEHQIQLLLLPKDSEDEYPCFIEIRAGTGGNEAAIFVGDLFRMYSRYAEERSWNVDILNVSEGEQGGYKEIIAKINGNGAYGRLKFESGGHRVQRVPETESQGRIHTSACTVAVIPELPEADLPEINMSDLKIDTFRSSGAGGQHVNTTDSAIRVTHIPTGIVVECQDERSQHKNKAKAIKVLSNRIYAIEKAKRQAQKASQRRNLLGSGDRSDRIRTYNFPQSRVTDHRINLTIYQLDEIMNGRLDNIIKPILQEHKADQLFEYEQ